MMQLSKAQESLLLLAAGALYPLALAPLSLWPLAFFSIAIFFWQLQQQPPKQLLFKAMVFGSGLFLSGVSWVYVSMHDHGLLSMPIAFFGMLIFCLFLAFVFALPFTLSALMPQTPLPLMLGLPAIWVIGEWIRSWLFTGFPWLYAGYSLTDHWLNGWAPIVGVLGLSYITAFGAAALTQLAQRRKDSLLALGPRLTLASIAALVIGGYALQKIDWTAATDRTLSVVLIQPNVEQADRWSSSQRDSILKQLSEQTEPYWGADIIIWPEGAIPALPAAVMEYLIEVDNLAKVNQTTLFTGIPTRDYRTRRIFNSMMGLGESRGQYDKTRLVPAGEYIPFEETLRGLNSFFDLPMSSFSLGAANQPLLSAKEEPIATAICYEIAYPDLVASTASNASMIMTVSNDAWFGHSMAPQQHMQMARMRAIENAKPLMRGTNNGITALVDYRGNIYQQLEQFTAGELEGVIRPRQGQTPFALFGSWPTVIAALLCCAVLILIRKLNRSKKI
jgi:apolipoprotein N-acyltransferase